MANVLLIDNYDSFVFNLARYFEELGARTEVVRNDAMTLVDIQARSPEAIVLSPGPGTPQDAGICLDVVQVLGNRFPILGVCLGHQVIGQALGGRVIRASEPVHGRTSMVDHDAVELFAGCPRPLQVMRYHSLVVEEATLPQELRVTARIADGTMMALAHRDWPVYGVQFHPESILTDVGHRILTNFLELAGAQAQQVRPQPEWIPATYPDDFYQRAIGLDGIRLA